MSEDRIDLRSELSRLESGDFEAVPQLIQHFIDSGSSDDPLLVEIGGLIAKNSKPGQWMIQGQSIAMFVQAAFFSTAAIATLAPIFEQKSMMEFTQHIFTTVVKAMVDNPETAVKILLFIASRAVQHTPEFYSYAVGVIVATTSMEAERSQFVEMAPAFAEFVDFEPDATIEPLEKAMCNTIQWLAKQNRENYEAFATYRYLNTMRFWSGIMFRFPNYKNALVNVAVNVINVDQSLKLNPFRLKVLEILIDNGEYLPCVAPLAKVLGKSFQEKNEGNEDFDWETMLVANKDSARTKKYQESLFSATLKLLDRCIVSLANKVCFPEIVAPVNRVLKNMLENQLYKPKENILVKFAKKIETNSKWVSKEREKEALVKGYDIRNKSTIEGRSPISK